MSRAKNQFFKTTTLKQALKMGPRKFVKDYLFPAMRREHGNGFAMAVWNHLVLDPEATNLAGLDGIVRRPIPACKSVMCIGGTMSAILGVRDKYKLADVLGVPRYGSNGSEALFYDWRQDDGRWVWVVRLVDLWQPVNIG